MFCFRSWRVGTAAPAGQKSDLIGATKLFSAMSVMIDDPLVGAGAETINL
jgi:hypothetical protein